MHRAWRRGSSPDADCVPCSCLPGFTTITTSHFIHAHVRTYMIARTHVCCQASKTKCSDATMAEEEMDEAALDDDAWASDGSDYESLGSEASVSDDEFSYDDSEDFDFPQERPRMSDISIEELERRIQEHREARTVHEFLTDVGPGTDDEKVQFEYSSIAEGLDEERRLVGKFESSLLHCACLDQDERRRDEKIRIILNAAKRAHVDIRQLLTTGQVYYYAPDWENGIPIWTRNEHQSFCGPLHLLISNIPRVDIIKPLQMICEEWPSVVHLRYYPSYETILLHIIRLYDEGWGHGQAKYRIAKILLEAAEKTPQGAIGLVSAECTKYSEFLGEGCDLGTGGKTAVDVLLANNQGQPGKLLPLFLDAWPDALKYCGEDDNSPLYYLSRDCRSRMKCIETFMRKSSLEALAFGLCAVSLNGESGFQHVMGAIEKTPDSSIHINILMRDLVGRIDGRGRTLLHYAAATLPMMNRRELRIAQGEVLGPTLSQADPTDAEWQMIEEVHSNLEKRNRGYVVEVCRWILSIDSSSAFVCDSEGMNPFQYALAKGKKWEDGLGDLLKLVPAWASDQDASTGLYTFMLAATLEYSRRDDSVDTIYELLRFDASIFQGMFGTTQSTAD